MNAQLSNSVRVTEHEDGALLLDVERGRFFSVDAVGTLIVRWLQNPAETRTLLEQLRETFPHIEEEQLQRDLASFLLELENVHVLAHGTKDSAG